MNKMPEGWKSVKLSELCDKISLTGIKINQKSYQQQGKFPVIDQGQGFIGGYFDDESLLVPGEPPYILFGDHTKIKKFVNVRFIPGADGVKVLKAKIGVDPKFLFYALHIVRIEDKGYARHFQLLEKETFPLPTYPVQQAIVSKIEELYSELDKGIENLKVAQEQLKVYRQSVLNEIITGEDYKKIECVVLKLDQGWSPKCLNEYSHDESEWAVIKTSAVQHGYFVPSENKILPKNLKAREQHELKKGDILLTRAGPRIRVGVCCLVRKTRKRLINSDKVYRIKLKTEMIKPEYFEIVLNSPFYQREIEKMKSGISDSGLNISQSKLLQTEIPVPSLDKQETITQMIEFKLSIADKMEESIKQSLLQVESLRQSILKKAFEGNLILEIDKA